MSNWFSAKVTLARGTGGYAADPHHTFVGTGTALARSPRRAVEQARRLAERAEGMQWMPILEQTELRRDGVLIAIDDPDRIFRVRNGRPSVRRWRL